MKANKYKITILHEIPFIGEGITQKFTLESPQELKEIINALSTFITDFTLEIKIKKLHSTLQESKSK